MLLFDLSQTSSGVCLAIGRLQLLTEVMIFLRRLACLAKLASGAKAANSGCPLQLCKVLTSQTSEWPRITYSARAPEHLTPHRYRFGIEIPSVSSNLQTLLTSTLELNKNWRGI